MLFVCVRERARERRWDRKEREGEGETGGVCVHALSWLTAGCYSSWHATPSSPHTSGVRLAGERRGKGEKDVALGVGGCNSVKTFLPQRNKSALSYQTPPTPTYPASSSSLTGSLPLSFCLSCCLPAVRLHAFKRDWLTFFQVCLNPLLICQMYIVQKELSIRPHRTCRYPVLVYKKTKSTALVPVSGEKIGLRRNQDIYLLQFWLIHRFQKLILYIANNVTRVSSLFWLLLHLLPVG